MKFLRESALSALVGVGLSIAAAGCGASAAENTASSSPSNVLRLGFLPNLTHATALVGGKDGYFAKALGPQTKLEIKTFNAGPAAVEALFSGAVDAAYIGPSPTINAATKSHGEAVRVVAGAASGGAALVVKPGITTPAELKGKKIATPQLGNTQDVALRFWLQENGLAATKEGGGDVAVLPQENSQTLDTFVTGAIDGAWVPEPYATRLVDEGGKVLVDERSLWPGGKFVTTHLVVRTEFLQKNPDAVRRLVQGSVDANAAISADPAKAQQTVSSAIGELTGKPLPADVVAKAWKGLTFTDDPLAASLATGAEHAKAVGLLEDYNIDGLYDLGPLDAALKQKNQKEVSQP